MKDSRQLGIAAALALALFAVPLTTDARPKGSASNGGSDGACESCDYNVFSGFAHCSGAILWGNDDCRTYYHMGQNLCRLEGEGCIPDHGITFTSLM